MMLCPVSVLLQDALHLCISVSLASPHMQSVVLTCDCLLNLQAGKVTISAPNPLYITADASTDGKKVA